MEKYLNTIILPIYILIYYSSLYWFYITTKSYKIMSVGGDKVDISKRLRELMDAKQMTIYSLAKASNVSWTTVKNLFNRTNNPTVATVELLCQGLGISMSEFFNVDAPIDLPSIELQHIIDIWEDLSQRDKGIIIDMVDKMIDS